MPGPVLNNLCRVLIACAVVAATVLPATAQPCCAKPAATSYATVPAARPAAPPTCCGHCPDEPAPRAIAPADFVTCAGACEEHDAGGGTAPRKCEGGMCSAVCCHVNALTPAAAVVVPAAELVQPACQTPQSVSDRADEDAVFHPPRA